MNGHGRLYAHDIAPQRIAALPQRAERAGAAVKIVETATLARLEGACDLVFVDAPCSGSGAWRRNPDSKWRLRPADLDRLATTQDDLIHQATRFLAPGGRIVYATCSILSRENDARVESFLRRCGRRRLLRRLVLAPPDGGDGFYAAVVG